MSKTVELRRHTDADGDVLTADGVRTAVDIGRRLSGAYDLVISSGAQRATQTAACFLAGMGRTVAGGVVVNTEFSSRVDADVSEQAQLLGAALKSVFESLRDGGSALVVGHSPTTEAAALGLTGQFVQPIAKGAGVRVVEDSGRYRLEPLAADR